MSRLPAGIAADASGDRVPAAYLLVVVAVVITALSYARMMRHHPSAGSAYTCAKEAIHPHVGFMVGWATTLGLHPRAVRGGAGQDGDVAGLAAGAAILALSFLGFDPVSTLAEEAEHPERDLLRAIFVIVTVATVFFVGVAHAMQSPASGRCPQQMSAARLLYAMGRDGVLPRRSFGRVSERTGVPVANTLLACSAVFVDLAQAASVINFGAFIAFVAVNLSVVLVAVRYVRRRGASHVVGCYVLPVLGVAVDALLFTSLDSRALVLGEVRMLLGLGALLWRTRLFRTPPPPLSEPSLDG